MLGKCVMPHFSLAKCLKLESQCHFVTNQIICHTVVHTPDAAADRGMS